MLSQWLTRKENGNHTLNGWLSELHHTCTDLILYQISWGYLSHAEVLYLILYLGGPISSVCHTFDGYEYPTSYDQAPHVLIGNNIWSVLENMKGTWTYINKGGEYFQIAHIISRLDYETYHNIVKVTTKTMVLT